MNRKTDKLLRSCLMIALACGILVFSIVSLDTEHICLCEDSHCSLCFAINFSQRVVMMMTVMAITLTTAIFLTFYFLAELYEKEYESVIPLNSLVYQKIQMNE